MSNGQGTQQCFFAINDEDLVGMVGQFIKAAKVAKNHLKGHVITNGDHLKIHPSAHAVIGVGHGLSKLLALLDGQALTNSLDNVKGKFIGHGRKVIGL